MNFSLAAISSLALLVIASVTTQAEARHMRHSTNNNNNNNNILGRNERDLVEEEEEELFLELSLSMMMPVSDEEPTIHAHAHSLPETKKNYTDAELEQFKTRFEKTSIGAALARWQVTAPTNSSTSSSSSSSVLANEGKSKAGKTKFCDYLLDEVLQYIEWHVKYDYFPTREVITNACSFGGTAFKLVDDDDDDIAVEDDVAVEDIDDIVDDDDTVDDIVDFLDYDFIDRTDLFPNSGCPAVAIPLDVISDPEFPPAAIFGYFLTDRVDAALSPFGPYAWVVGKFSQYCQCHQGYELGCAAKIPYPRYEPYQDIWLGLTSAASPADSEGSSQVANLYSTFSVVSPGDDHAKWQEYCKFVAIWNADVSSGTEQSYHLFNGLSKEVQECGCYFVASAEAMVAECPGVELFGPLLFEKNIGE